MANHLQSLDEPRLSELLDGIVRDAQELLKQQLALFRSEIHHEARKTKDAFLALAVGSGLALLAGLLAAHLFVHLLAWLAPDLPLWSCYAIVAALLAVAGGAFLWTGKRRLEAVHPLPEQSVEALKENVQWIARPR